MRSSRLLLALSAVAIAKIATGTTALLWAIGGTVPISPRFWLLFACSASFAIAGALLLASGRGDDRARSLGTTFLLIGSEYADQLIFVAPPSSSPGWTAARFVLAWQVDAFTPYCMWRFAQGFPRTSQSADTVRWFGRVQRVAFAVGGLLLVVNLFLFVAPPSLVVARVLAPLGRHTRFGFYWLTQFTFVVPALVAIALRARRAPAGERRRVAMLAAGLVVGATPTVAYVMLTELRHAIPASLPLRVAGWVVYPTLLSTPFSAAYAVLVHHALDVRLVVRRAFQYALTRYATITAATVPLVLLVILLYRDRRRSLAELATAPAGLGLGILIVSGFAAAQWRGRLLERIDAHFFREQYDARRILGRLLERSRGSTTLGDLATTLCVEVDRALHPQSVHALFLDPERRAYRAPDGGVRPLASDGALAAMLSRVGSAVEVDLEHPHADAAALPDPERYWVADAGARLLVPLIDPQRRLAGLLTLGEKRSELPYVREDRVLLDGVAGAAVMALALREVSTRAPAFDEQVAAECTTCGAIDESVERPCRACGAPMRPALLPRTIAGKFLLDSRIGAGGMGVVYRATDLELRRTVALKTLPAVSPAASVRLRREARVMASLRNPQLATIYGVETWRGCPILIVEYLSGGTLADRLAIDVLPPLMVVDLGIMLSDALASIHREGVLHGDVKPSNIGFDAEGIPRLLDFGLSRLLNAAVEEVREVGGAAAVLAIDDAIASSGADGSASRDASAPVLGTPRYMAPEARAGEPPTPAHDIWALAVVMYEAITGRHPWIGAVDRSSLVPTGACPLDAPRALVETLRDALTLDRSRRIVDALTLRDRLRAISRDDARRVASDREFDERTTLA